MSSMIQTAANAMNIGVIVAIVVSGVAGLLMIAGILIGFYCACCRKKRMYPTVSIQKHVLSSTQTTKLDV